MGQVVTGAQGTRAALLLLLLAAQSPAQTAAARVGQIAVTQAWSRPTPPAATVAAVYFSINNRGTKADQLVALSSPIAAKVILHQSRNEQGVVKMREMTALPCPAGATVMSEPGALHVMLIGLNRPLAAGMVFPLSLQFRDAGNLTVQVAVLNHE
jgi:periplasmic copper chaperone A